MFSRPWGVGSKPLELTECHRRTWMLELQGIMFDPLCFSLALFHSSLLLPIPPSGGDVITPSHHSTLAVCHFILFLKGLTAKNLPRFAEKTWDGAAQLGCFSDDGSVGTLLEMD